MLRCIPPGAGAGLRRTASLIALAAALAAAAAPAAAPLKPAERPAAAAWTAPATVASAAEDVSFRASDGVTLRGTLVVPRDIAKAPLVVVLHGASSPSRDEALSPEADASGARNRRLHL